MVRKEKREPKRERETDKEEKSNSFCLKIDILFFQNTSIFF
jgi:hypothetical protein